MLIHNKKTLAQAYGVSVKTLCAWLKRAKVPDDILNARRALTPAQLKVIYDKLGSPD